MRIVAAEPAAAPARRTGSRAGSAARVEWLALAAVSLTILLGTWLTFERQSAEIAASPGVNVNAAAPGALAAALHVFANARERDAAAGTIGRWIAAQGPLTHVGALSQVRHPDTGEALFTAARVAAVKPGLAVRTRAQYGSQTLRAAVLLFAPFWLLHLAGRVARRGGDPFLLPAAHLLTGVAFMAMLSLRDPLRDSDAATGFVYGVALGCLVFAALSFIDFENPRFRRAALLPLGAAVALATALVLFGGGPGQSGVKVNLLGVQPIEAIRILAVLALASIFSRRWELLREISEPAGPPALRRLIRLPRLRDVKPLVLIVGTLLVFFVLQRDLGPALVLGCIAIGMYGVARARISLVVMGFAGLAAGFALGYALGVPATLARRVAIWLDPWNNTRAGGDQIAHALWALASGGTLGAGTGGGDGHLVPAGQTDLIVSVIGEELGFIGLLAVALAFALLVWRTLRIASRAPGDYTAFLALGAALSLAVPAIIIVGAQVGLVPLSGVATPFLSFGKSSTIASFAALGIASAIARRSGQVRPAFAGQIRTVGAVLGIVFVATVGRMAWLQVRTADEVALRPALVREADGDVRYRYNPRLLLAARLMPRGTVLDRQGYALATSDRARTEAFTERLRGIRAGAAAGCLDDGTGQRCYPLGGMAYHVLGESARRANWAARNTSFVERDWNPLLQGFDDHARLVDVRLADGLVQPVVARDYSELLPLVRARRSPGSNAVQKIVDRPRDLQTTVDGTLQALVSRALEARARVAGSGRGAAVVIDTATGEILALASYPWPSLESGARVLPLDPAQLLDRARYGLYPPGSTFKLVTAAAALGGSAPSAVPSFMCERLPDGRVGAMLRGVSRPVRDDELDRMPHGRVDLRRGIAVSCNAYFAQLAAHLGSNALAGAAAPTGIRLATSPARLSATLPHAGYGQGEVVASPLRLARLAAAIATDGVIREAPLVPDGENAGEKGTRWLRAADAAFLRAAMREVVTSGSGRALAGHAVPIAGKTGTAEVGSAPSHSWFVGFAPYGAPRIAFAVIVENAGYGGRVAAPLAGDVVSAAASIGLLK